MRRAVCPGSFDPITYGHLDIIERASRHFDEVIVAVLENRTKSSLFTVDERISMISEVTKKFSNVRVDSWSGLLVDYCKSNSVQSIVKAFLSSSLVKELAHYGGDVSSMVPPSINEALKRRVAGK